MNRIVVLAVLLSLGGCEERTSTPALQPPQPKVMSLNPCIDAILVQVADPAQILSISHYSHDPRATSLPMTQARRFPLNYATAEEVIASRPDLVLLGAHVAPATQRAITDVGVQIESVGVPATIEESRAQILQVARAVGHEERGRALLAEVDAALAGARPAKDTAAIPALIRMSGGLVPGTGTLADELMSHVGFRNMSEDYGLAMWDILPVERMIAQPPRILLTEQSEGLFLGKLPGTQLVPFSEHLLQCAGPNLIEAVARLTAIRRAAQGS